MWTDHETESDFLNFTAVASTVSEIIVQSQGRPISIGVSGAWGVGKSSMIKLIQSTLQNRSANNGKGPKFIFVEFNAWLHQGHDDARAALLEVVATALAAEAEENKNCLQKTKEKAQELLGRVNWFRLAKVSAGSAAAISMGLPPVGLIGEAFELGKKVVQGHVDKEAAAAIEGTADKVESTTTGLLKAKPASSPPKEIHELRKSFEETLEEMGVTLVVLIDDLDRCLPETTISTLEAIRLLLFLKHTAFVIAADDQMIKHAVKRHFQGVDDDLVTNYFDKLIQVPIRVPPLGTQEVRAYMMMLFIQNSDLDEKEKEKIRAQICQQLSKSWQGKRVDLKFIRSLNESLSAELVAKLDTADRLAQLMATASGINRNPRLVKRFLNALAIRMAMSKAQGVGVDESVLAKVLLFERCANPNAYSQLTTAVSDNPEGKANFLQEVSNYVAAMNHGLSRLREGFPMSMRLIKAMHGVLMSGARGGTKAPGEFRRTQNWIGGTQPGNAKYVPPPPERVADCMSDLEKYLHNKEDKLPLLIRAALVHRQFETIHPFLDGNGRLGRLLITLLLCTECVLSEPILYLSLYFKTHRQEYYARLQNVRESGDWESWLHFFLDGVNDIAVQATDAAREILGLIQTDRAKIAEIGRGAGSALQAHQYLEKKPLVVIPEMVKALGLTTPTVTAALQNLAGLGIVREITGKRRGRVFVYDAYLKILERGTEPLR